MPDLAHPAWGLRGELECRRKALPFNASTSLYPSADRPSRWSRQVPIYSVELVTADIANNQWRILSSGQPYNPWQLFLNSFSGGNDYFDGAFLSSFIFAPDSARPFWGNPHAPVTSVGIFAADACTFFLGGGSGMDPLCLLPPSTLVDFVSLNTASTLGGDLARLTPRIVSRDAVRFIANGREANRLFGTRSAMLRVTACATPK